MPSEAAISKPVLPPLQTPKSASFPSEIVSTPMSAHPLSAFIKQEQDLKTPITPPTAYTDFLKALTPMLASPPPSALGRTMSDDSTTSNGSSKSSASQGYGYERHLSPTSIPTPHSAPVGNGRGTPTSLMRLRIPSHSPMFSPSAGNRSPRTSMSFTSGMYSPAEWTGRASMDSIATPRSACSKPVSVRSVVTRTVTYKRTTPTTPIMEPAPKGKRRKLAGSTSSINSKEATPEPRMRLDRIDENHVGDKDVKTSPAPSIVSMPPPAAPAAPTAPVINVSPATSANNTETDSSDISSSESSTTASSP